jgi:hypothetical protein
MSCCGGGRSRRPIMLPRVNGGAAATPSIRPTLAVFRYDGDKPLIVIGRVTQAKYRFAGRGSEVAVDIRDRTSVRQVPRLRELRLV